MNIEYIGRGFTITDQIRDFAARKLQKLEKFLQEPVDARLTLETEKHRQIAELHVTHRFGVLQASEETDSMVDAVNLVVDKAEKQARRNHKKFTNQRRRAAQRETQQWPVDVVERDSVGNGREPRIIRSSALAIKPMSLEEAALQLESGRNDFVVFRDAETDRVSVLYRRRDENYGLIAPEF